MTPIQFFDAVRAYCAWGGCSITSYYRTPDHNAAVGGVAASRHQIWLGCDVVYDDPLPLPERQRMATKLGIKVVAESDHDHLQSF